MPLRRNNAYSAHLSCRRQTASSLATAPVIFGMVADSAGAAAAVVGGAPPPPTTTNKGRGWCVSRRRIEAFVERRRSSNVSSRAKEGARVTVAAGELYYSGHPSTAVRRILGVVDGRRSRKDFFKDATAEDVGRGTEWE